MATAVRDARRPVWTLRRAGATSVSSFAGARRSIGAAGTAGAARSGISHRRCDLAFDWRGSQAFEWRRLRNRRRSGAGTSAAGGEFALGRWRRRALEGRRGRSRNRTRRQLDGRRELGLAARRNGLLDRQHRKPPAPHGEGLAGASSRAVGPGARWARSSPVPRWEAPATCRLPRARSGSSVGSVSTRRRRYGRGLRAAARPTPPEHWVCWWRAAPA